MELPLLYTRRLLLRPFELTDADAVQRLAGDKEVAAMTLNVPHPYLDGMAESWISTHMETCSKGMGVTLAVVSKGGPDILVGCISLLGKQEHEAELGYWIGKDSWGQGFCTEAAGTLLGYGFSPSPQGMGLQRVRGRHLGSNPASGRVMQKIGMQNVGMNEARIEKWGKLEDEVIYELCRGEHLLGVVDED